MSGWDRELVWTGGTEGNEARAWMWSAESPLTSVRCASILLLLAVFCRQLMVLRGLSGSNSPGGTSMTLIASDYSLCTLLNCVI